MKRKEVLNLKDSEIDNLIKIQGTDFDRRRKLSNKDIATIRKLYIKGNSISYLASKYGVTYPTIVYHISDENKFRMNMQRSQYPNSSNDTIETRNERVNYKRKLVASRKYKTNKLEMRVC